jgi:hypothetical protein
MKNEVVIYQLILFHKPNKKVRSENKMDHFITRTKHTLNRVLGRHHFRWVHTLTYWR